MYFFIYAVLTAILLLCIYLFRYVYPDKTTYFLIGRVHTVIEFAILTYIFSICIKNNFVKKFTTILIVPFLILSIYDYFLAKEPSIAYVPLLTECLFFIALIIYFFFEKIKQDVNEPLFNTFIFWLAVAFLLNFSGNFLLYVYSETAIKDEEFKTNYAIIYSTVTIIKNILLCIAVTMKEIPVKISGNNNDLSTIITPAIYTPNEINSN